MREIYRKLLGMCYCPASSGEIRRLGWTEAELRCFLDL